jgi:hypothetical protein
MAVDEDDDDADDLLDPLLDWMIRNNVPLSRSKYLGLAFGRRLPEPWTPEDEAELPRRFRQ